MAAVRHCRHACILLFGVTTRTIAQTDSAGTSKTFFTLRDVLIGGAAFVASAALSPFDERIARWTQRPTVQGDSARYDFVHSLTFINETPLTAAAFATYAVGRLSHSDVVADVGLHTTEALVLTTAFSELVWTPLGRARPRVSENDAYAFHFGQGFTRFEYRAFPSLHAAVAFATAASLVGELRERHSGATVYVVPLLYAAALVPGITRMYLNQHWASDVLAGAVVGQLLGARVVHYAHTHRRSKLDRSLLGVTVQPDGHGGAAVVVSMNR